MENLGQQKMNIVSKFDKQPENQVVTPDAQAITDKFDKKSEKEAILEKIENLPKEERLAVLKELGVVMDVEGYDWGCLGGDRFYVFANINGVPVPMYKTSARTEGKREDRDFFPFFGCQTSYRNWLLKGDVEEGSNKFYGYKELDDISYVLTKVFNFNTDRYKNISNPDYNPATHDVFEKQIKADNFIPDGNEVKTSDDLNELLEKRFGVDFDVVNALPAGSNRAVHYVSEQIFSQLNKS